MNNINDYRRAAEKYLANCRADGLSARTLENYADHLDAYAEFCRENDISPADPASALDWKIIMHESGMKNSSVAVYMRDVRRFFCWATMSPVCDIDAEPVTDGMIPKVKRQAYDKLLSEDDIISVLSGEKQENSRKSHMWARNNAMVVLFLESAVRVSELTALTPADLDFDRGIIQVRHGKGDKMRYVTFPALAQQAVLEYLDSGIRPFDLPDTAPLFGAVSKDRPEWHALDRHEATKLVNRHVKAVTGRDDIRAHALRHASASAMLTMDMPKEQIQALLGHSSIQTTERYIGLLRPEAAAVAGTDMFSALERRAMVREVS